MVWSEISLFYGLKVSGEQILAWHGYAEEEEPWELSFRREFEGFTLYRYPCCSEVGMEFWLVGFQLRSYSQARRPACGGDIYEKGEAFEGWDSSYNVCGNNRTVCQTCYNRTDNGHYPSDELIDTVYSIPLTQVCPACFHHHRSPSFPCPRCSSSPDSFAWQTLPITAQLMALNQKYELAEEPQIYLVADDCNNCT